MARARYDGVANWYDETFSAYADEDASAGLVAELAARFTSPGQCVVDVGCGTGLHFGALQARKLNVLGFDLSGDQLRIAKERADALACADAVALPVADHTVATVISTFVHTDVDDFASLVAEVARVLRPGGRFIYLGTHPCFIGPFIKRTSERDLAELSIRPGYGSTELAFDGSGSSGLKAKVGSRNLPLAEFLGPFLKAGLALESFDELDTRLRPWSMPPSDGTVVPWNVLLVAVNPAVSG